MMAWVDSGDDDYQEGTAAAKHGRVDRPSQLLKPSPAFLP